MNRVIADQGVGLHYSEFQREMELRFLRKIREKLTVPSKHEVAARKVFKRLSRYTVHCFARLMRECSSVLTLSLKRRSKCAAAQVRARERSSASRALTRVACAQDFGRSLPIRQVWWMRWCRRLDREQMPHRQRQPCKQTYPSRCKWFWFFAS